MAKSLSKPKTPLTPPASAGKTSTQSGYTGTAYLHALLDVDSRYATAQAKPTATYLIDFSTPGTYTLWLRGYAHNATGDSA